MAKDVGVFMCGGPVSLVNQVRSSRGISVSSMPVARVHHYRIGGSVQGGRGWFSLIEVNLIMMITIMI